MYTEIEVCQEPGHKKRPVLPRFICKKEGRSRRQSTSSVRVSPIVPPSLITLCPRGASLSRTMPGEVTMTVSQTPGGTSGNLWLSSRRTSSGLRVCNRPSKADAPEVQTEDQKPGKLSAVAIRLNNRVSHPSKPNRSFRPNHLNRKSAPFPCATPSDVSIETAGHPDEAFVETDPEKNDESSAVSSKHARTRWYRWENLSKTLTNGSTQVERMFKMLLNRSRLTEYPVCLALTTGCLLPKIWTLGIALSFLVGLIFWISLKWGLYHWNSRDVRLFRRTSMRLYQRLTQEMERTIQGEYARQVAASIAFWACTAPGESTVAKFLRWQTSRINSRIVQELESARDRYFGYERESLKYHPFA